MNRKKELEVAGSTRKIKNRKELELSKEQVVLNHLF